MNTKMRDSRTSAYAPNSMKARVQRVVRGRRFRMDSPVTEADIHHPTDSGLLADAVRRVTRRARRLRASMTASIPIQDRARCVKRRILEIGKVLKRRTGEAVIKVRRITEELARIGVVQGRAVTQLVDAAKAQIAVLDQSAAHRVASPTSSNPPQLSNVT